MIFQFRGLASKPLESGKAYDELNKAQMRFPEYWEILSSTLKASEEQGTVNCPPIKVEITGDGVVSNVSTHALDASLQPCAVGS